MRAILLIMLLLPIAAAQEAAFGFTDASLDAFPPVMNAYADLTTGALEKVDESTLRATIALTALPETQPGLGIGFLFMAEDIEWYVALVHAEALVYYYGRWENGGPASNSDTSGSYTTGPGAIVTIDFPLAAIPNVTEIDAPRGLVGDFKALLLPTSDGSTGMILFDEAVGEGTLVVRDQPPEPEGSPAPTPAGEVGAASTQEEDPTMPTTVSPQASTKDTPFLGASALLALALALALALRRRS